MQWVDLISEKDFQKDLYFLIFDKYFKAFDNFILEFSALAINFV